MKQTITINWKLLGAELATLDADDQANFFNGFANELMEYETHTHREIQLLSVNDKLNDSARETIEKYFPCLWYKDESERS